MPDPVPGDTAQRSVARVRAVSIGYVVGRDLLSIKMFGPTDLHRRRADAARNRTAIPVPGAAHRNPAHRPPRARSARGVPVGIHRVRSVSAYRRFCSSPSHRFCTFRMYPPRRAGYGGPAGALLPGNRVRRKGTRPPWRCRGGLPIGRTATDGRCSASILLRARPGATPGRRVRGCARRGSNGDRPATAAVVGGSTFPEAGPAVGANDGTDQ